jgi:hypothetical protein
MALSYYVYKLNGNVIRFSNWPPPWAFPDRAVISVRTRAKFFAENVARSSLRGGDTERQKLWPREIGHKKRHLCATRASRRSTERRVGVQAQLAGEGVIAPPRFSLAARAVL